MFLRYWSSLRTLGLPFGREVAPFCQKTVTSGPGVQVGVYTGNKPLLYPIRGNCDGLLTGDHLAGMHVGSHSGKPLLVYSGSRCASDGLTFKQNMPYNGVQVGAHLGKPLIAGLCECCSVANSVTDCFICTRPLTINIEVSRLGVVLYTGGMSWRTWTDTNCDCFTCHEDDDPNPCDVKCPEAVADPYFTHFLTVDNWCYACYAIPFLGFDSSIPILGYIADADVSIEGVPTRFALMCLNAAGMTYPGWWMFWFQPDRNNCAMNHYNGGPPSSLPQVYSIPCNAPLETLYLPTSGTLPDITVETWEGV